MQNNALILHKLLIAGGFLTVDDNIQQLLKDAKAKEEHLLNHIIQVKKLDETKIGLFLALRLNLPFIDVDLLDYEKINTDTYSTELLEQNNFIPIRKNQSSAVLIVGDPTVSQAIDDLKFKLNVGNIQIVAAGCEKIKNIIKNIAKTKTSSFAQSMDDEEMGILETENPEEQGQTSDEESIEDAPVVKFVQKILLDGVKQKVSDIHFEPYEKYYRVRYRLDGALFETSRVPLGLKEKIASRIKVMSRLDISEKRIPQDGRIKLKISADKSIDFRVSTLPTLWGEKIVMRILDSSAANLNIDILGYDDLQKQRILDAVKRPYGMVLVTGPTGSGKTVSLYTCMNILNQEDVNIATAEDPAEINLAGINQVNVNEKAGLTFAAALKSFLRQDPDIIMVGEIRDLETADIAIKAAQTGHLVLSTLHTNDAPTTLTRLMNMGVKPFNIASSVILITAQRLARKLCPTCKEKETLPADVLLESGFQPEDLNGYNKTWFTYKAVGCSECNNKGYKGRVGIYQVMPITEEIQKIILAEGTALDIAYEAKKNGVLTLRDAGLQKVKLGVTSLEEVEGTTNS